MISANSRYANSTVMPSVNLDGNDAMVIQFTAPTDLVFKYTFHQVTADDRVDMLASRFLGDPTLWWVIANANPEILDWSELTPGYPLRIPGTSGLM